MSTYSFQYRLPLMACFVLALVCNSALSGENPPVPDFTRGGKKDDSHDWNLGPTGARGWIHTSAGNSALSRQILVTAVAKGSPADGILNPGDVILGVGEKPFEDDARKSFARAITAAEEKEGVLRLVRWRDGRSSNVELKLPVLGAYSATAPYDCPKSKKIFDSAAMVLAKAKYNNVSIPNNLNALALLASGREEYRPLLADYARKVAAFKADSYATWHYGYSMLFLSEYALATRDVEVMAGLNRIARESALGQSAMGTWGHKFARPDGNLNGYGCMNAPGLVLLIGMVVARDAGVKDADVDKAIAKGSQFLRWYVNKGAIPYGDHPPWPWHEDNGKCSMAAVLFDLLGDQEAAGFFARMSTAAYDEREQGHTGNFFNVLWALPGVSRAGPIATGAYWKEQGWYYDLAREWDGRFSYQGAPVGAEEHRKYTSWDCTGAYMLTYALQLKSLNITGKKPCSVPALNPKEVEEVISAVRDYFSSKKDGQQSRPVNELLSGLSSWSPTVRRRSAQGLSKSEGDFVPTLLKMLSASDRETRYGACEALGALGPRADAAAPQLRELLEAPDPWLRCLACKALPMLGPEARKASVSNLLKMTANPSPDDPRQMAHRAASMALFAPFPGSGKHSPKSILADSLEGVDRELLYPAIRSVLENQDSVARGSLSRIYGKLTDRDLIELMPSILKAIEQLAPSNEMFGDGIRLAGLDLVSRLHVREGMQLCIAVIEPDRWGLGDRFPKCLEYLGRYGVHAQEFLPQLKKMRADYFSNPKQTNGKLFDEFIAKIEASKALPKLISLQEFKTGGSPTK